MLTTLVLFLPTGCNKNPNGPAFKEEILQPLYFDHPAWHPAGDWIAVEHADSMDSDSDGKFDAYFGGIWLVNAQTGATQPLLRGFTLPAWSSDGKKLALVRGAQIYTIDIVSLEPARVDNSSLRRLTFEGRNFFPAWSPDGQWIAYDNTICGSAVESPPSNSCGVLFMSKDGYGQRLVSLYSRMPVWHPVDLRVLFVNRAVLQGGEVVGDSLWIYDVQRQQRDLVTFLTGVNYDNRHPKYSPDGKKIAFYSQPRVGPPVLWLMDNDGANLHKISPAYAQQFDWSPDGQRLAFIFWNFFEAVPGNGQIWLINADGTGLRQLTFFQRRR